MNKENMRELRENMIFVGTIYDSFEALEETLGKLKLEKPLFITHIAKMSFAEEVFKRADNELNVYKNMNFKLEKCRKNNDRVFNYTIISNKCLFEQY